MRQAQLFIQFFLLVSQELLLVLHLKQAGDTGGDRLGGEARVLHSSFGWEDTSCCQEYESLS